MHTGIFLLLGSNQGASAHNLSVARQNIEKHAGKIISRSAVYKSAPWGMQQQPDFFNQVLEITTSDTAEMLLEKILYIEKEMGRVRLEKWGPRKIDIDLLFFRNEVRDTQSLTIPHPGIPHRRFTLVPLAEIAADFVHPVLKKAVATLLEECEDGSRVERVGE